MTNSIDAMSVAACRNARAHIPSRQALHAEAVQFYRARALAGGIHAVALFRRLTRSGCEPGAEPLIVELLPTLVLRVQTRSGGVIAQSMPGRIAELDASTFPSSSPKPGAFLAMAVALYNLRTRPDSIYSPPLFTRRLKPHDSGFSRAYTVDLTAALVLRVRDNTLGVVHAQSYPGQIDRLDPCVALVVTGKAGPQ